MPLTLTSFVAEEVRVELIRKRKTQTELAEHLGVSQATVARRLSGQTAFDTTELELVAQFLDISIPDLIGAWPNVWTQSSRAAVPSRGGAGTSTGRSGPSLPRAPRTGRLVSHQQ